MASFKGRFTYSLDEKGRIALPAKLRRNIPPSSNDQLILTRGFEQCIYVYPLDEWNKIEEGLRKLSRAVPKHRFVQREMMQWGNDVELDSQSRMTLPQDLLKHAGIEKEVLIIGVLDRIEVWNPKKYEEYMSSQSDTYETVSEQVLSQTL